MRVLACLLWLMPGFALAADWELLKQPGTIALMRHALAPGTGDPVNFDVTDCSTQRNLDSRGREQARRIGEAMRAADVSFDAVWTSQWCRCKETAALMNMGRPEAFAPLNSHFAGQGDPEGQAADVMARLQETAPDARLLLVTHQVNIAQLTGRGTASGEIIVARLEGETLVVIGDILISP